ncbi:MAG: hypothetical protein K6G51_03630 [Sphaerochaetaceae bacterium]|nr:hypothetical protein [Sphaerochaetaceae bacterium]
MKSDDKSFSVKGLYIAVGMLLVGMTGGFFLLSLVYTGPSYVRLLVYFIYLFIVYFVIKSVVRLSRAIKEEEQKKK